MSRNAFETTDFDLQTTCKTKQDEKNTTDRQPVSGSIAEPTALELLQSLPKTMESLADSLREVMAFFEHEGVPFDNNQAERDLRMTKLRDKICLRPSPLRSGCGTFRSARHALAFCNLHGVMSTARKQKRPMLATLGKLLSSPETLGKSLASQG